MTRWDWLEGAAFGSGLGLLGALAGVSAAQDSYLVTAICIAAVLGAVGWLVAVPAK